MATFRRTMVSAVLAALLAALLTPSAHAAAITLKATQHPTFGLILTDPDGRTLYRFTRDTVNTSSACYGQCATNWPPLLVGDGTPIAGEGVDGNLLGVLTRTDGTRQVMYNGMPLYYFAQDAAAGETNGQRVRDIWFIVHPNSTTVGGQPVTVRVRQHEQLGALLTDDQGRTLYLFTRDTAGTSVCYDRCATNWPPLLAGAGGATLADGVGGALGSTLRDDGNRQVTYEGKPLYYFANDKAAGDTKGQGVNNVWYVVAPASAPAAAPAAAPAPAALPRTAGEGQDLGLPALLAAALIAAGGLLLGAQRRRRGA